MYRWLCSSNQSCRHLTFNNLIKSLQQQYISTTSNDYCLCKKMATHTGQRILVYLQGKGGTGSEKAQFTQCIVNHFNDKSKDGITQVDVTLHNNCLHISAPDGKKSEVKIKHPPFCPLHGLSPEEEANLPKETLSRGIDCGAAVILETGDGRVLLTRRADTLRTFPGIWVPPGGHIEEKETLMAAGLRELKEETGLTITPDMCCQSVDILALWESAFPPKLTLGPPKRHHAVVYLLAKLKPEFTSEVLQPDIQLCTTEVGACAWFERSKVKAIVAVKEDDKDSVQHQSDERFRGLLVREDKTQVEADLPFSDLLKSAGDITDQKGRVSTGTKFALEEWLDRTS